MHSQFTANFFLKPGTIRCSVCRGYINPFFKFIEGGAKFQCNLCGTINPVPEYYQCNLDSDGIRVSVKKVCL